MSIDLQDLVRRADLGIKEIRRVYSIRDRLYWRSAWVNTPYVSQDNPVILAGCDRSGTTLVRAVMDSHRNLAIGPEAWLFAYKPQPRFLAREYDVPEDTVRAWMAEAEGLAPFIERFFNHYRERMGKGRWGEKSPSNVRHIGYILEHFPKARIIHVIRDPRDTVCSLREFPKRIRVGDEYVPNEINRPIGECVRWWKRAVNHGLQWRGHPNYIELRYEDLVEDAESALRPVIAHIGEEWDDALLNHSAVQKNHPLIKTEIINHEVRDTINRAAMKRWEKDLTPREIAYVERETAELRRQLNYT